MTDPRAIVEPLTFALASCLYPAGLLDARLARRSLLRLADTHATNRPEFLLLVGDQIYVDATGGMFDPASQRVDRAALYATADATAGMDALYGRGIDVLTMLDDHEIIDNWEPLPDAHPLAGRNLELLHTSRVAYAASRRTAGPGALPAGTSAPLWYTHQAGGHRWFIADTRTERGLRDARTVGTAELIGTAQSSALAAWLRAAPSDAVSFVASPAILLPRRLTVARDPAAALFADAWDGYPASLHGVLALLCEIGNPRVVFLSGDEHIPCVATITLSREGSSAAPIAVHSIHGPALYAPYPFANASEYDFARNEAFEFVVGGATYRCAVETRFPAPGDGFALIRTASDPDRPPVTVEFHCSATGAVERWP